MDPLFNPATGIRSSNKYIKSPSRLINHVEDKAEISRLSPVEIKTILVPTDLRPESIIALRYALTLAKQFDANLTLLHVLGLTLKFGYPAVDNQFTAPDDWFFRSWTSYGSIRCFPDFPNPFSTPIRMPGILWCKRRNMPRSRSCFLTGARRAGSPHRCATRSAHSVFSVRHRRQAIARGPDAATRD
jgi:hypothetical protein